MFERFTERARQVVVLAQDEARALGHGYIGTEHLLLGILREEEGLGARVLRSLEITVDEARVHVARVVGRGDEQSTGQIPFTPQAKRALELSLQEALSLNHNYIGTEHVLLGLVRASDGVAVQVLEWFGVDPERVRRAVGSWLSGWPDPAEPEPGDIAYTRAWWRNAVRETQDTAWLSDVDPAPIDPSRRDPAPVAAPEREAMLLRGILIGWGLAGATLGAGLLVGWLIWG